MAKYEDYRDMIATAGEILAHQRDQGYEGYEYFVVGDDEREDPFGFALVSFGSCNHCDPIQRCDTEEQEQMLCDSLVGEIQWFQTIADMLVWFDRKKDDRTHLLAYLEGGAIPDIRRELEELANVYE